MEDEQRALREEWLRLNASGHSAEFLGNTTAYSDWLESQLSQARAERDAAQFNAAAMRGALEALHRMPDDDGIPFCVDCGASANEPHPDSCKTHAALASDAGARVLAVVEAARAVMAVEKPHYNPSSRPLTQSAVLGNLRKLGEALDALDGKTDSQS